MKLRWKIAQWFEQRWWKNYLSNKNKEEYLVWKKRYWENILSKIPVEIKINSSKIICDAGCGPAGIFIALPDNKIIAVEPLILQYEKQTSFFKRSDYPNTTFIQSTIEEFQTREVLKTAQILPEKYDFVFCMNAINHVHEIEKGFIKMAPTMSKFSRL